MNAADANLRAGRRRGWFAAVVTLGVLVGLVALALDKLNPSVVGHALAHVSMGWIGVAVVLMAAAFFARGESWYASSGPRWPASRLTERHSRAA